MKKLLKLLLVVLVKNRHVFESIVNAMRLKFLAQRNVNALIVKILWEKT